MWHMGPERMLLIAAVPIAYDRNPDQYLRWEYPREDVAWTHGRLPATSAAPPDKPVRYSIRVRLSRLFKGGTVVRVQLGRPQAQ